MRSRTTLACRRGYEVLWTLFAGAGSAVGFVVAVLTSGAMVVASLFVATAAFAVMMLMAAWLTELECRVRPVLVGASVCALVEVVTIGLNRTVGPMSFVVVSVLLLASPPTLEAVSRVRSRRAGRAASPAVTVTMPSPPSQPQRPLPDDPDFSIPDSMAVADLCEAWRSSYVALERARSLQSRLRVVRMREIYLDELERRAGPGMRAWLGSGPRAAGDPSRWVVPTESMVRGRALLR